MVDQISKSRRPIALVGRCAWLAGRRPEIVLDPDEFFGVFLALDADEHVSRITESALTPRPLADSARDVDRCTGTEYPPSIPAIDSLLRAGGRVADIGCGLGWSSVAVARQYPNVTIDGFDPDVASVGAATRIADQNGLGDRISFHPTGAADAEAVHGYDLVMALECIHDLSRHVDVLVAMRELVSDTGVVTVMDERVDDELSDPEVPSSGCSTAARSSCLPDGMSDEPSAATGTVMRPCTLERYALDAGFASIEVLPIDNDSFRFYRMHTG